MYSSPLLPASLLLLFYWIFFSFLVAVEDAELGSPSRPARTYSPLARAPLLF